MSYRKGNVECRSCGKNIKFCWLFPDWDVTKVPDRNEFVFGNHTRDSEKYTIVVRCANCNERNVVYCDLNGDIQSKK